MHKRTETRGYALVSCFIVSSRRWLMVRYLLKCLHVKCVPFNFHTAMCSKPHVIICFLLYGLNLRPNTGKYPVFLKATVLPYYHWKTCIECVLSAPKEAMRDPSLEKVTWRIPFLWEVFKITNVSMVEESQTWINGELWVASPVATIAWTGCLQIADILIAWP
jgi:hypothetical protein